MKCYSTSNVVPLLVSIVALGAASCSSKPPSRPVTPQVIAGIELVEVEPRPFPLMFETTGVVQAAEIAQLMPQMTGTVTNVNVTEGSRVAKAQVLATINAAQPQAGLDQARGGMSAAQHQVIATESAQSLAASTMQRYELLHQRHAVSAQEYDEFRQKLQLATANLDVVKAKETQANSAVIQADTALAFTRIRAPFAGVVTHRFVDPGALASLGLPLFTIEGLGRYRLVTSVDESELSSIHVGGSVHVKVDAIDREIIGNVLQVYPAGDADTHSFTVKIELPQDAALRSGLFGRVDFVHGTRSAIMIPTSSILRRGDLTSVYVVGSDQIAQLRYITLGDKVTNSIEVLSGLTSTERIVASPNGAELGGKRIEKLP